MLNPETRPHKWTNAAGFECEVIPLTKEQSELTLKFLLEEKQIETVLNDDKIPAKEKEEIQVEIYKHLDELFLAQIVLKRIRALQLPIVFNYGALKMIHCFGKPSPGSAVTILIDALNKYEGQTVTVQKMCELYPYGFYSEKSFTEYVDNYLKPAKIKWSEIYAPH